MELFERKSEHERDCKYDCEYEVEYGCACEGKFQ